MKHLADAILGQHTAIVGKTGSGKTYTAKGAVERLLSGKKRVAIVDPTGAWWGLRSSSDGRSEGFPIIILGGQHGDAPLPPLSGSACAELVAGGNVQIVFDTLHMTVGERTRWFTDFAGGIFRLNRSPLHLVIDEAHMFAPQSGGSKIDVDTGKMLHAANTLASGGRSRGVRLMLITQRPAKLHKDSLTCCDTLIAMRVIAPQDREAIEDWILGCGDKAKGRQVLDSLAQLAKGEGWVWFPEGGVLERMKFPPITTFDSSKTPEDGGTIEAPRTLAQIDLAQITKSMESAVRQAQENDPKHLREEIRGLRAKLADAAKDTKAVSAVDVDRLVAERTETLERAHRAPREAIGLEVQRIRLSLEEVVRGVSECEKVLRAWEISTASGGAYQQPQRPDVPTTPVRSASTRLACRRTPCEKILDAIAWWKKAGVDVPTRVQVACVAGYTASGGTFNRYISTLSSDGLVEYPDSGSIDMTEAGRSMARWPEEPPSLDELHRRVGEILETPHRKILDVLLNAHGKEMARTTVAELAGYDASGGTFNRYVSHLSSMGLIRYPRKTTVAAAEILFPEGLQ